MIELFPTMTLYDTSQSLLEHVQFRVDNGLGKDPIGLPTGFDDLDYAIGGWRKDDMIAIAGASGSGKSAMALSLSLEAAERNAGILYISLEMSAKMLALRTLSGMTGVPAMKIERGDLKRETLEAIKEAALTFQKLDLHFFDKSMASPDLTMYLLNHKNTHHLDICVVDYLGLMKDTSKSPYERMTTIADNVRLSARDADVTMLAVSQINRESLKRPNSRPRMQDLKDSGQVENNSSVVMFPFRPEIEEETGLPYEEAELIIDKNRHGPTGIFPVRFYPKQMRWTPNEDTIIDPPNVKG